MCITPAATEGPSFVASLRLAFRIANKVDREREGKEGNRGELVYVEWLVEGSDTIWIRLSSTEQNVSTQLQ
jgi:hypothetical protein